MSRTAHRVTTERCFFCDQERLVIRTTNVWRICLECLDNFRADLVAAGPAAPTESADPDDAWPT